MKTLKLSVVFSIIIALVLKAFALTSLTAGATTHSQAIGHSLGLLMLRCEKSIESPADGITGAESD